MDWIKPELARRAAEVDQILESFLAAEEGYPPSVHEAMRYSVMAGGKRLRPILTFAAAEAVGGNPQVVQPAAIAIELIHTYSLIHDDLPAMDNDDLRRGKPTCHKVFGEASAILAGDALLTLAFEVLARTTRSPDASDPLVMLQVIQEIAQAAGTRGMIGGQVVDLEAEGKPIDAATLDYIHRHKTGALIRASVRAGALLGGAKAAELADLSRYAEEFGLAFQIADDILDIVGDEITLGKPVGSDVRNEKATYPALWGLENARAMAAASAEKAIAYLADFTDRADFLRALAHYVVVREK
jgi:geranylgeranyl diphosphate synthase type II